MFVSAGMYACFKWSGFENMEKERTVGSGKENSWWKDLREENSEMLSLLLKPTPFVSWIKTGPSSQETKNTAF